MQLAIVCFFHKSSRNNNFLTETECNEVSVKEFFQIL